MKKIVSLSLLLLCNLFLLSGCSNVDDYIHINIPIVNCIFQSNPTKLIASIKDNDYDKFVYLIEKGADINKKDAYLGTTPLEESFRLYDKDRLKYAKYLLEKNCEYELGDILSWVLYKRDCDTEETEKIRKEMFFSILEKNNLYDATIDHAGFLGGVIDTYDYNYCLIKSVQSGLDELTEYLLKNYNFDLEYRDIYGDNALIYSIRYRNPKIFRLLVEKGSDINIKDADNRTISDLLNEKKFDYIGRNKYDFAKEKEEIRKIIIKGDND